MKPRRRSFLILLATLLIGMVLGALIQANFLDRRMKRIHLMRTEEGFVMSLLDAIQPSSPEQEERVRAVLEETAPSIVGFIRDGRETVRQRMEAMCLRLEPMLDPSQMARLNQKARRGPPDEKQSSHR